MLPFPPLRLTGRAVRLTPRSLVRVQVIISGGEVRQPVCMLGPMWFLKPWPFDSIE